MDRELEQRIRERAYELWMQHGSQPGRAEEYWYQAERDILGDIAPQTSGDVGGGTLGNAGTSPLAESADTAALDTTPAPLGMTSQTIDEILSAPAAAKTRKRRAPADPATAAPEGPEPTGETPKRRRSTRTS